jgi:hypothetical protein
MENAKPSTAQQPVWDFAKFGFVMGSFFFYAVVDAIIAIVWQVAWAIIIAVCQVIAFLVIECLLYHLYIRGIRKYILFTNLVVGAMGVGALVNMLEAGLMLGEHATNSNSASVTEATFLILAAAINVVGVCVHFIVQSKAGRSVEYKPIDMEQFDSQDDELPAIVNPPEATDPPPEEEKIVETA